jgi:large subunit ribosomal protein L23
MKTHRTASPNRVMQVLLAPVVSEKSTMIGEKNNQYAFRVLQDATKAEVKAAIETFFKVEVDSVNMINIAGKTKRFAKGVGRRRNLRKAYESLKAGQEINFAETK